MWNWVVLIGLIRFTWLSEVMGTYLVIALVEIDAHGLDLRKMCLFIGIGAHGLDLRKMCLFIGIGSWMCIRCFQSILACFNEMSLFRMISMLYGHMISYLV